MYRHPEPEPGIEDGVHDHLLYLLPCFQILTANVLVCSQQHCLYSLIFSIKHWTKAMDKTCIKAVVYPLTFAGIVKYASRMTLLYCSRMSSGSIFIATLVRIQLLEVTDKLIIQNLSEI